MPPPPQPALKEAPFATPAGYDWDPVKGKFFKKDPKVKRVDREEAQAKRARKRKDKQRAQGLSSDHGDASTSSLDRAGPQLPVFGLAAPANALGHAVDQSMDLAQLRLNARRGMLSIADSRAARSAYSHLTLKQAVNRMRIVSAKREEDEDEFTSFGMPIYFIRTVSDDRSRGYPITSILTEQLSGTSEFSTYVLNESASDDEEPRELARIELPDSGRLTHCLSAHFANDILVILLPGSIYAICLSDRPLPLRSNKWDADVQYAGMGAHSSVSNDCRFVASAREDDIILVYEIFLTVNARCGFRPIAGFHPRIKSNVTALRMMSDGRIFVGLRCGVVQCWRLRYEPGNIDKARIDKEWEIGGGDSHMTSITALHPLMRAEGHEELIVTEIDGSISLWDVSSSLINAGGTSMPQRIRTFEGHVNDDRFGLPMAIFAPARLMAALGKDGRVRIWSLDGAQPLTDDSIVPCAQVGNKPHECDAHQHDASPLDRPDTENYYLARQRLTIGNYLTHSHVPVDVDSHVSLSWMPTCNGMHHVADQLPALFICIYDSFAYRAEVV